MTPRLAIVPARGGSKGIPGKNLSLVGGMTLLARAVRCALDAGIFDAVVVSTDDERLADEGRAAGALVPELRPAPLATDDAPVMTAVRHMLQAVENNGRRFELIALLEPTSPLRTAELVRRVVSAAEQDPADAAFSVSPVPTRYHSLKQFVAGADGLARYASAEGERIVNRQQLGQTFIRNGMCYAVRRSAIDAGRDMLGSAAALVLVEGPVVNIDDPDDLDLARRLIEASGAARTSRMEGNRRDS